MECTIYNLEPQPIPHIATLLLLLQNTVQASNRVFRTGMYNIEIRYQVHIYCN